LAAFGNYVYATDDSLSSDASGIVRFEAGAGLAAQRFAEGTQHEDLAAGYDGRLCALDENDTNRVDIYDLETVTPLGTVFLDWNVRGIAVNAKGEIFGTTFGGVIYPFDQSGTELDSLDTDVSGIFDIDLSRGGEIVAGRSDVFSSGARVVVTDESLAAFS
jgi:hypothetical protein